METKSEKPSHIKLMTQVGRQVTLQVVFSAAEVLFLSFFFFFKGFIYLLMRDTQREAETQAEGEAGSSQGVRCGTQSQDPGITP